VGTRLSGNAHTDRHACGAMRARRWCVWDAPPPAVWSVCTPGVCVAWCTRDTGACACGTCSVGYPSRSSAPPAPAPSSHTCSGAAQCVRSRWLQPHGPGR
jgi:hypothetical protein